MSAISLQNISRHFGDFAAVDKSSTAIITLLDDAKKKVESGDVGFFDPRRADEMGYTRYITGGPADAAALYAIFDNNGGAIPIQFEDGAGAPKDIEA